MKQCFRCNEQSEPSAIGEMLYNFVCDPCRLDSMPWEFKGTRINDMEYESVTPHQVLLEQLEKANVKKVQ